MAFEVSLKTLELSNRHRLFRTIALLIITFLSLVGTHSQAQSLEAEKLNKVLTIINTYLLLDGTGDESREESRQLTFGELFTEIIGGSNGNTVSLTFDGQPLDALICFRSVVDQQSGIQLQLNQQNQDALFVW